MFKKFTFKTEKATGRYRSIYPDTHNIKLNKFECGLIDDKKPYKIQLQVIKDDINKDGNPNCDWEWITLKKESESLQEAKNFLNENHEAIQLKYKIYTGKHCMK